MLLASSTKSSLRLLARKCFSTSAFRASALSNTYVKYDWEDPFNLESMLTEEERIMRYNKA